MATLQQVAAGVAHYYDVVVRPSISDVGAVAVQLKDQMTKAGGRMTIQIGQDSMSFTPEDVDKLVDQIDRIKA